MKQPAELEMANVEKSILTRLFKEMDGNLTHIAAGYGKSIPTVRLKLIRLGLLRKGPRNLKP